MWFGQLEVEDGDSDSRGLCHAEDWFWGGIARAIPLLFSYTRSCDLSRLVLSPVRGDWHDSGCSSGPTVEEETAKVPGIFCHELCNLLLTVERR